MSEKTRTGGRALAHVLAVIALTAAASTAALGAPGLRIEAEEFKAYGSYNIGGSGIRESYCSYASGGLVTDGLDVPGEWFKLKVTFPFPGCYTSRIDYQSAYEDTVVLRVRMLDAPVPGEEMTADYTLVNGYGFG